MSQKKWTYYRARVASLSRTHAANHPTLIAAKRDLRAAMLAARVEEVVASWPPLTDEQRDRIVTLLHEPSGGGRHAS